MTLDEKCASIAAVRRAMNTLISERTSAFQQSNSQVKAPRGKRLANNSGLNIIDDALVYMTVKEKQEKKHRSQQSSLERY